MQFSTRGFKSLIALDRPVATLVIFLLSRTASRTLLAAFSFSSDTPAFDAGAGSVLFSISQRLSSLIMPSHWSRAPLASFRILNDLTYIAIDSW